MIRLNFSQLLDWAVEELEGSDSPQLDAQVLLSFATGHGRTHFMAWPEKQPEVEQQRKFQCLIANRKTGIPVAHLTGQREFWSLLFKTNDTTLIPRPDTEVLVEVALELVPPTPAQIVDLGTGTGAIAIALASECSQWQLIAVEKNSDAVRLAQENRDRLGYENVQIQSGDWLQGFDDNSLDAIVTNPPYIEDSDPHLDQGDVRFEPRSALTAGADGLDDYRIIIPESLRCLKAGGWLILEHGHDQSEELKLLFLHYGFEAIETRKDYGGNDRITYGQKPKRIPLINA